MKRALELLCPACIPICLIIVVVGGMDHISKAIANAMPSHLTQPHTSLGYFPPHSRAT